MLNAKRIMEDNLYIYPTTKSRIVFGVLVAIVIASHVVTYVDLNSYYGMSETSTIEELEIATRKMKTVGVVGSFIAIAFLLSFSVINIREGKRSFKLNQYPSPGSLVFFKTKILTGKAATRKSIMCYVIAGSLFVFSFYFVFIIWFMFQI